MGKNKTASKEATSLPITEQHTMRVQLNIDFTFLGWSVTIKNKWQKRASYERYIGAGWTQSSNVPKLHMGTVYHKRFGPVEAQKCVFSPLGKIAESAQEYGFGLSFGDRRPFTAICFDGPDQDRLVEMALKHGMGSGIKDPTWCLHHVTLALRELNDWGGRCVTVTHVGMIEGRVSAFRVSGAEDSCNPVPHITAALAKGAKARESNDIKEWIAIEPFEVNGQIRVIGG
tara:strand:+ start:2287 stop:2973 length:687 start_codon:yes stop_codon:yes gene_type:complete